MKICTSQSCNKVGELQPLASFYKREPNTHISECKACFNLRQKILRDSKPKVRRETISETEETKLFNSLNVAW